MNVKIYFRTGTTHFLRGVFRFESSGRVKPILLEGCSFLEVKIYFRTGSTHFSRGVFHFETMKSISGRVKPILLEGCSFLKRKSIFGRV